MTPAEETALNLSIQVVQSAGTMDAREANDVVSHRRLQAEHAAAVVAVMHERGMTWPPVDAAPPTLPPVPGE